MKTKIAIGLGLLLVPLAWAGTTRHIFEEVINYKSISAPGAPTSGDMWNQSGVPKFYNGSSTKSLAFLDSSVTGNAATATALAANGANCSAGSFPLGVDASGASETCTALPTTITGTSNQVIASGSTGAITLTTPQSIGTGNNVQFGGVGVGVAGSSGKMLVSGSGYIGTTTTIDADVTSGVTGSPLGLAVTNNNSGNHGAAVISYGAISTGATIDFFKTRHTDTSADTIINDGDGIMTLRAYGATGTAYQEMGRITINEDTGVANDATHMPGKMTFATTNNGTTVTNAMTIDSSQVITALGQLVASVSFKVTNLLMSATAPTVSSGFGSSPSIASNNGTAAFTVNVGTGGSATSGVIGLPTAATGWNCFCTDITTASSTVFLCKQTASSTTTATIGNFNTSAVASAWVASDIVRVSCFAY